MEELNKTDRSWKSACFPFVSHAISRIPGLDFRKIRRMLRKIEFCSEYKNLEQSEAHPKTEDPVKGLRYKISIMSASSASADHILEYAQLRRGLSA